MLKITLDFVLARKRCSGYPAYRIKKLFGTRKFVKLTTFVSCKEVPMCDLLLVIYFLDSGLLTQLEKVMTSELGYRCPIEPDGFARTCELVEDFDEKVRAIVLRELKRMESNETH